MSIVEKMNYLFKILIVFNTCWRFPNYHLITNESTIVNYYRRLNIVYLVVCVAVCLYLFFIAKSVNHLIGLLRLHSEI